MYKTGKGGWWKHWDFILLDLICLQIAFVLAFMIRHGWSFLYGWDIYRKIAFIIIFVEACVAYFTNNYTQILYRGYYEEFKRVIVQITIVEMIIFTYFFLFKVSGYFSRATFLYTWILGIIFTYFSRILLKHYLRKKMENSKSLEQMILVTTSVRIKDIVYKLTKKKYLDVSISKIILLDEEGEEIFENIPVISYEDKILEELQKEVVDQIFIDTYPQDKKNTVNRITEVCKEMGITIHFNLEDIIEKNENTIVETFADCFVITYSVKFANTKELFLKRAMDLIGGIVGVAATLILAVIFGPIIYAQSPGPIFFSQERIGKNGRRFKIYKFRSMYPDAEERKKELMAQNKMKGLMFKMDNDPRIIPIGRFMRKTSLDEFPQFFNILKGDMSLVGTRPPTVDEFERYEAHHKVRLAAKPGLTGLWQVSGRSDIVDFEEVVELDKKYIENWNIGLDLRILVKTIKVVFTGKGSA